MEFSLWILIDKQGRIYYTGDTKQIVEDYYKLTDFKDLIILETKGEY